MDRSREGRVLTRGTGVDAGTEHHRPDRDVHERTRSILWNDAPLPIASP